MFTVFHKGSCRQAKMDVTCWNPLLGFFWIAYLYWTWRRIDCTCWVVGEWRRERCHMSCLDLCAWAELYPELTSPLCHLWLTSGSHAPQNKQPFFFSAPPLSVTLSPCSHCHSLPPVSSPHVQGTEVISVRPRESEKPCCWRTLMIMVFFGIMGGIMSGKQSTEAQGKPLLKYKLNQN